MVQTWLDLPPKQPKVSEANAPVTTPLLHNKKKMNVVKKARSPPGRPPADDRTSGLGGKYGLGK
jgi:hypothetical protein